LFGQGVEAGADLLMRRRSKLEDLRHPQHDVIPVSQTVAEFENDGRRLIEIMNSVLIRLIDDVAIWDFVDFEIFCPNNRLRHRIPQSLAEPQCVSPQPATSSTTRARQYAGEYSRFTLERARATSRAAIDLFLASRRHARKKLAS
jgi:hypothetical protein